MKTTLPQSRIFAFAFPSLDTQVLVEDHGDSVEIRATRDAFTDRRKAAFIRELAAEGFIDDHYGSFSQAGSESCPGVRWSTDFPWLEPPTEMLGRTRRFMVRLLLGSFLLWGSLVTAFMLRAGR